MGAHKTQRTASTLIFFSETTKMAMNFSVTLYELTCDETWVLFVNVETKKQSKQWTHTHSPQKSKRFKPTLSVRKLIAPVL
jgi:hypothetical protein